MTRDDVQCQRSLENINDIEYSGLELANRGYVI